MKLDDAALLAKCIDNWSDPPLVATILNMHEATFDDLERAGLAAGITDAADRIRGLYQGKHRNNLALVGLAARWSGSQPAPAPTAGATVVCKLQCNTSAPVPGGQQYVRLHAVYEDRPGSPNKVFTDHTPAADFSVWIAPGKPAAEAFKPGQRYMVTFTPVDD